MSTLSTTEEFLGLYQKSDLHDAARFAQHFPDTAALPADPRDCAATLVQSGLLTSYQSKQLLLGKYKGFVLGSYKILQPLGQGGMGTVFLAEHIAMKRRVALKVVQTDKSQDKLALERFHREARSAAALDHPNIVRLFDVGQQTKVSYLAMEYVDGETLDTLLEKGEPPPYSQAVAYIVQAAAGLQHAHEKGMVHRDIKPSNLILARDGTVKLLDMGLARCYENEADNLTGSLGTENEAVGTADYASPEQALNKALDARSDIYSLGATLYALIAGFPPFQGNMLQKLAQHQTVDPTPLASLREEVPEGLSDVVLKMMAKKPSRRYASADEVIEALGPWLPGAKRRSTAVTAEVVPVEAVVPSMLVERPQRRSRAVAVSKPDRGFNWGAAVIVGGSILFALLCLVGVAWLFNRPTPAVEIDQTPDTQAAVPAYVPPPLPPPPVERKVEPHFVPLSLDFVATATTRRPLFNPIPTELVVLPESSQYWFQDVPFRLVPLPAKKVKNVIVLNCTQGTQSMEAPDSVTLPVNAPVTTFHFLGGVAGWGWPWKPPSGEDLKGKVVMRLNVRYEDNTVEEHEWRNGEEVADYISRHEVPGSTMAFHCGMGKQVRYLTLRPRNSGQLVKELVLEKGEIPEVSSLVIAVTVEKPR